jgi:hypothetical protein
MKGTKKFNKILGMTLKDAKKYLKDRGFIIRMIEIDGVPCICTNDYKEDRVNVYMENDRIVRVYSIG